MEMYVLEFSYHKQAKIMKIRHIGAPTSIFRMYSIHFSKNQVQGAFVSSIDYHVLVEAVLAQFDIAIRTAHSVLFVM